MKEQIKESIAKALQQLAIEGVNINIETPANRENGDYSTNIAMQLAKTLKDNPMNIAEKLVLEIKHDSILKIEIKSPGFINLFLKKDYLLQNINRVLESKENYGRNNIGNNEKVNVEFVSANPTGYIHVGTARCASYGDSICRILNFAGFDVTREYYFNDGGAQIDNLGKSLYVRYQELCGLSAELPEDGYHGEEIIDIAKKLYSEYQDTLLNKDLEFFKTFASDTLIAIIKQDLEDFGVTFNVWTSEQTIRKSGNIEKCLETLKKEDNSYEEDGATWLKSTKYGDDKDRVLIKTDGSYTYLVPDIAYHLDKINRGFTQIIDVLGADHHGYISRLKASVEALGFDTDKIRIKMVQMVRLLRNCEEVKMSKRTGLTVTMRELIEDVGTNAARYFFAARSLDSQMDFDLDLAKSKSKENPVYYVSYAYARICTILENNDHNENIAEYITIDNDDAYNVLESVYNFESIVKEAALKELPHLITNYVYDLANKFHTFYEKTRIVTTDEKSTKENINLIKAVKITIENALNLIGVIPPAKM